MDLEKFGDSVAGNQDLQKEIYKDLGQEATKKAGSALGDLFEFCIPWIYKVRLRNAKKRMMFDRQLKLLAKEIGDLEEDKVVEIPSGIGEPALEKMSHTTDEDLASLFRSLLSSAANADTVNLTHPAFVDILGRLSTDEAKIIKYLKGKTQLPFLNIRLVTKPNHSFSVFQPMLSGIEDFAGVVYQENIGVYLENLISMGILETVPGDYLIDEAKYQPLYEIYAEHIDAAKQFTGQEFMHKTAEWEKRYFTVTAFGKLFIKITTKKGP